VVTSLALLSVYFVSNDQLANYTRSAALKIALRAITADI
jgi:hypothetical protein